MNTALRCQNRRRFTQLIILSHEQWQTSCLQLLQSGPSNNSSLSTRGADEQPSRSISIGMAEVILLVALGSFGSLSGIYCAASPEAFGVPEKK